MNCKYLDIFYFSSATDCENISARHAPLLTSATLSSLVELIMSHHTLIIGLALHEIAYEQQGLTNE